MIRLKNLLIEGRTKKISLEKGRDIYNKSVSSAYHPNKNDDIYRGIRNASYDVGIIRPRQHKRQSAHTSNYYTLIMDNAPEWQNYPDRSKSVVCTTSNSLAKDYGEPYKILPFSGAKLGTTPERDIWYSFSFNLDDVNTIMNYLLGEFLNINKEEVPDSSYSRLKSFLKEADKELKKGNIYSKIKKKDLEVSGEVWRFVVKYLKSSADDLFEFYRLIIHPERNDIELKTYKEGFEAHRRYSLQGHEVWTEDPCLVLKWDGEFLGEFFKDDKYYMKKIDKID